MRLIKQFWKSNKLFVLFILLMSVFRSAVADWYTVPTGSMQPTIKEGDRIVVNKMAYDIRFPFTQASLISTGQPKHGEIIVFESDKANTRLIKRVIGLPGDIVEMKNEILFINGEALSYQKLKETDHELFSEELIEQITHTIRIEKSQTTQFSSFGPVTVPSNHYLVLGDNRRNSADSRFYGFVPHHELKGKATAVAFSFDYDNYYLPRENRFFKDIYSL